MKISKLMKYLFRFLIKYGNVEIDIITEDSACQVEQELGDIAYDPSNKRVKLLPKGF